MALHSDQLEMSVDIGSSLQFAVNESLLTNTNVAAADTNQGLQDAVTAATCAADVAPSKPRIIRAIQMGSYDGTLSDANILSLTTTAGLLALTQIGSLPTNILIAE
jgi:hypothetical protein